VGYGTPGYVIGVWKTMIIKLHWPDRKLFPNSRVQKKYTNDIVQDYRYEAKIATLQQKNKLNISTYPTSLTITFFPPDKRRRDSDSVLSACKPAIDGIFDALGFDDSVLERITITRGQVVKNGEIIIEANNWIKPVG